MAVEGYRRGEPVCRKGAIGGRVEQFSLRIRHHNVQTVMPHQRVVKVLGQHCKIVRGANVGHRMPQ